MNIRRLSLLGLAFVTIAIPVYAAINAKITGASHSLEDYSTQLHGYMHGAFGTSMGAHGMEVDATALHDTAHDWSNGAATDADVVAGVTTARTTFDAMTVTFNANGVLSGPNQDKGAKDLYKEVHKYMVLSEAYTASAD